jgi:hypothetical protein
VTSEDHVPAEVLAAWTEGRLAVADSATVETHLSSCASCQEMLAVFARTEPESRPDLAVVSGFSWFRWRWAVPAAAAATAAAIWVAVPNNPNRDEFERTVAPAIEERAAPPAPASADTAAPAPAPAEAERTLSSRRDAAGFGFEDRAEKQPPAADEPERDLKADVAESANPAAARAAEAPAAPEQNRLRAETVTGLQRQAAAAEVISPDALVRWRIVAPGRLERSTDGASTWQPVTLPQPADLVAVQAPSATSAIVTAADGRQFRTDDQGKTWNPVQP